jgi:hypothetical protein
MSLHTLAQHLQSAGRGEDKVLVHMTPREVQGLQTLAMAHGGSLTINPQTGLPEAGFLSAILPMVAGAFLGPAGMAVQFGGMSSAMSAGLLTAGIGTLATGSLGKGLMMGLGAYGGAGLGQGLLGTAASRAAAAAPSAAAAAAPSAAASAALDATKMGVIGANPAGVLPPPGGVFSAAPAGGTMVGGNFVPTPTVSAPPVPAPTVASATSPLANVPTTAGTVGVQQAVQPKSWIDVGKENIGKLFAGGEEGAENRKKFLSEYGMPLAASGAAMYMLSQDEQKQPNLMQQGAPIRPSRTYTGEYSASATPGLSGERQYTFFADGGLADLPVEQMSQQASTGANTNYPMANIRPYGYAVPRNVPISENVVKPMDYQRTDPYTGEQQFAGGGLAALATGGFISKLKPVAKPAEPKPKLQSTTKIDKQIKTLEKYSDLESFQNQVTDLRSQLADLNKNKKANAKPIANITSQLKTADAALKQAKAYQASIAARDKMIAANDAVTAKAQSAYDAAMNQYNEYQDKLAAEKQAWKDETGRKATGVQTLRPQAYDTAEKIQEKIRALQDQKNDVLAKKAAGPVGKVAQEGVAANIDKQIAALNAQLKTAGQYKPLTAFAYDSKTKRLMEEKDINDIFQDVAGRRPTAAEMQTLLGTVNTDANIAKFASKLPDVTAKMSYTDDDYRENWQYYTGREPTSGELAAMKKAKLTNFNQLRDFIKKQPAFLENINKLGLESVTAANKLPIETISTTFRDLLGRQPTAEEIDKYSTGQTPQSLVAAIKQSEDYKKKFTQGLVPGLSFEKYAPGTVLEYTPTQQAQTGLGTIGGLMPTPSGLQTPQTRGAVTIQGAMPLNPTFQEQLGLQTLAAQAAETAPALQRGLRFDVPTAQPAPGQIMPGLMGLPQLPPPPQAQPQNYEQQLANIGEKQIQPAAAQPAVPGQPAVVPVNEAGIPITALANTAPVTTMAMGGYAGGGYHLGDYSDGGRLLKGPGDGVSDSIPASIGNRQPARLADGEFVIPARIVSEIGNGSTDAGARRLYAMMDRVQKARRKSIGKGRVAVDSKAEKLLPA